MYKAIGARIKQRRRKLKLTQEALAQRVGISLSFVGHIERGSRILSVETLVKLTKALDCTSNDLLGIPSDNIYSMPPAEKLLLLLNEAAVIAESFLDSDGPEPEEDEYPADL